MTKMRRQNRSKFIVLFIFLIVAATSAPRWWWSAVVSDVIVIDCTPLHKILQQGTQGQMSDVIVSNSVQSKKNPLLSICD